MRICICEDSGVAALEPLTLTRPAFALRCGATSLLERQRRYFAAREVGFWVRPGLESLCLFENPGGPVNDGNWLMGGPILLVNARWLAPNPPPQGVSLSPRAGLVGDEVAYLIAPAVERARLAEFTAPWPLASRQGPIDWNAWTGALPTCQVGGGMVRYPWDLIERNHAALLEDFLHLQKQGGWQQGETSVTVHGPRERLLVYPGARIDPFVLVDTTDGPVLIDEGVRVQSFSRLQGPCYLGPHTQVFEARIHGGSFGPQCRLGGEIEESIIHGYSNKAHEGFLGHSYLGEWVNLGAGTYTSDLRNDYGTVKLWVNGSVRDTGLLKVGSFIGDHTKTSIGTLLNTGTVVGPFGQLLTSGTLLPRVLPAFVSYAHGRLEERTSVRHLFTTAARVMARRGQTWTDRHADFFLGLYERTAEERRHWMRISEQRRLQRVI
jgi:UDP-N-acetylglucosamine diphosphorylase/glucosamine-1-phosphate N-acetyltransferase